MGRNSQWRAAVVGAPDSHFSEHARIHRRLREIHWGEALPRQVPRRLNSPPQPTAETLVALRTKSSEWRTPFPDWAACSGMLQG